jgi:hypothetical protein
MDQLNKKVNFRALPCNFENYVARVEQWLQTRLARVHDPQKFSIHNSTGTILALQGDGQSMGGVVCIGQFLDTREARSAQGAHDHCNCIDTRMIGSCSPTFFPVAIHFA